MTAHSLRVQIQEIEREIRMRREVYPRQVSRGKYRRSEAEELIAIMESVRATLIKLQDQQETA
jgi:hypothetical protein